MTLTDPFLGIWHLSSPRSAFDPNHRPRSATLVIERTDEGHYVMQAEGISEGGEVVKERTQRFILDGEPHPIPDLPGFVMISSRPDFRTIENEARGEDGTIAGRGAIIAAPTGTALTLLTYGVDAEQRAFKQQTVFVRRDER